MMPNSASLSQVFSEVLRRLDAAGVEYMVVGSIAAVVYGEPRLTKDLDLVVDIPPQIIRKLDSIFPGDEYYCPPLEVLQDEFQRRGQFNVLHPQSGLKIDFVFRKPTPHGRMEFSRRKKLELWPGLEVYIASPEDIVLKKLEYYREGQSQKHLVDIRGILAGSDIDLEYLKNWIEQLDLNKQWQIINQVL